MRRFLLSAISLSLFFLTAAAKERSEKELLSIAKAAIRDNAPSLAKKAGAKEIEMREVYATKTLKVYSADAQGFVVLSRDDMFSEVLGVSNTPYTEDNQPDGFRIWLKAVDRTMADALADPAKKPSYGPAKLPNVPNFISTQWAQDAPYNYKTPASNGRSTATGCVATAMAQIFNYYQYPDKLNGKGGYSYSITLSGNDKAEKSSKIWTNTKYDWANMRNTYTGNEAENDPTAVAVANLMRDCGYAVHMDYHYKGSASYTNDVPYAVAMNFRYDSLSVAFLESDIYTADEWFNAIYSELGQKHPILYAAVDEKEGGHAFVFSGMKPDGKVYVNWGWGGGYDGFFDVRLLNPGMNNFEYNHRMVVGFNPEQAHPSGMRQEYAHSQLYYEAPELLIANNSLHIKGAAYNLDWRDLYGRYVLCLESENPEGEAFYLDCLGSDEVLPTYYGMNFNSFGPDGLDFQYYMDADIPDGKYYFSIQSLANDEYVSQVARSSGIGPVMWEVNFKNKQPQSIKMLSGEEALAVGIDNVVSDSNESKDIKDSNDLNFYNLQGQRVSPDTKGIVIRKGKKILRK